MQGKEPARDGKGAAKGFKWTVSAFALLAAFGFAVAAATPDDGGLDRVLNLMEERTGPHALAADRGGAGLWQRLLKLRTTGSVLYTTAHPDDEQGGVLTYLSRGRGVRVSMLTLNRGESGANAIGSELFEGLGLIRTEELLVSDRYYGLDSQYFTTMLDYGYSKTLQESLDQWGKENVLRDVVRVIRINRPLVLVSRFHGSQRDGHGNHQTAGVVTQEAFEAAGDPTRFPEQISEEGLRPWQPLKMYRSNLRPRSFFRGNPEPPTERWQVAVDAGEFSPWLGTTYQNFSALGLSFQRSQNSGRMRESSGPYYQYFERFHSKLEGPEKEADFFDGIDTRLSAVFRLVGEEPSVEALGAVTAAERHIERAIVAYSMQSPAAVVPFLSRALAEVRTAIGASAGLPDSLFLLRVKERQLMDAVNTALGVRLTAVAVPAGAETETSPWAPAPSMGIVVPGQKFNVDATLSNPSDVPIEVSGINLGGTVDWGLEGGLAKETSLESGGEASVTFSLTAPGDAEPSRRYFYRDSIKESRYKLRSPQFLHLPARPPALAAVAHYSVGGQPVEVNAVVYRREPILPYGDELRELKLAPALVVNLRPKSLIVPLSARTRKLDFQVEVLNNQAGGVSGELVLDAPDGWRVQPAGHSLTFAEAGERRNFQFSVSIPELEDKSYRIAAVARAEGKEFREGYDVIDHRDYDVNYLYDAAVTEVRGVDVSVVPDLNVGYVMGVGDEVPSGIEQLGAKVTLLTSEDLATGDLSQYDTIAVGTRAYAVRQDLITYNRRLLDYAKEGGNLVVLYQTQEFVPQKWAPYPAELPRGAEEVSEEDSPVRIVAPDHPVFQRPNRISASDFDGWVEQRGSKFFSEWDARYTPMIETQDQGQEPQQGGWLTAPYGRGYYTYFAYAIHRQVPYGVPGPYRIFANVLSLGRR